MKNTGILFHVIFLLFCFNSNAQATATFTASVTIIQPVGITTTSNMNFANLDAGLGGQVILSPENGRSTLGDVQIADGGQVSAATFEVTGEPGFTFAISLPQNQYQLTNGKEQIIIRNFTSNIDGSKALSTTVQKISVGATLDIEANQAPGHYSSAHPMSVTVNYN